MLRAEALACVRCGERYPLSAWADDGARCRGEAPANLTVRKAALEPSPLVMAFILADVLDTALRQALLMGDGSPAIFATRPLAAVILLLAVGVLVMQFSALRRLVPVGAPVEERT